MGGFMGGRRAYGFGLTELIILTVVITVVAAFAYPQYQNFAARTQVTRALKETADIRLIVDNCLLNDLTPVGKGATECDPKVAPSKYLVGAIQGAPFPPSVAGGVPQIAPADLGLPLTITATFGNTAFASLKKAGQNTLVWTKGVSGAWTCTATVPTEYRPASCK